MQRPSCWTLIALGLGLALTLAGALALVTPAAVHAQEVQVPLDEGGEIEEIDRSLAGRLGLFLDEYPDLRVVRLYRVDEGDYVLEVTFQRGDRLARQRVPMTAEEARALRGRVTAALTARAPRLALDQDGRFLLLTATTTLGLGFYGWAVPVMLDIDSGRGFLASYMLTAGASFVVPYLYTRQRPVTYGMANAGFWGASRGLYHGILLALLFDNDPDVRAVTALGMAGSLAEGLAGYTWALRTGMSAGDAHTIGNFGDFGSAWGGYAMVALQPDAESVVYGALLAGAAAGLPFGVSQADRLPYTWGDAEIERAAFYLGAANGAALWELIFDDDAGTDEIRVLAPLLGAGSVGGLWLARQALPGHDFSAGQGILVDLGTLAGGLLGMGVAVLLGPENLDDPTPVFLLGALGADLGFYATFASLSDDARERAQDRQGRLDLQLNPTALALLHPQLRRDARSAGSRLALPLLSLSYRF